MKINKTILEEILLIEEVSQNALDKTLLEFQKFTNEELTITSEQKKIIDSEFKLNKKIFISGLQRSRILSEKALKRTNQNKYRIAALNKQMSIYLQKTLTVFPNPANIWIMNGLIIRNQRAGIKSLAGFKNNEGDVIDVLSSAASLSLGAHNPWLIYADRIEDALGIRDNIAAIYHPSLRQSFALNKLAELHPNKNLIGKIKVHSESSGAIVNTIAIESSVCFAEKSNKKQSKMLAVDGSWSGGYGTAREATGFGIDAMQIKRSGNSSWVERVLPNPTKENENNFLDIIKQRIRTKTLAGVIMEPDLLGDAGILSNNPEVLIKMKDLLLKENLPIIFDCVQQIGRTGSYWGEFVNKYFSDYPQLVLTTGKSASNGLPFAFVLMPQDIADSSPPLTQLTTNQMNGPLLRAIVVSKILNDPRLQKWIKNKGFDIERVSTENNLNIGQEGLRGKYLNRAVYVGSNENVKLAQIALLIEDGILVGALPESVRYQPNLVEFSITNSNVAQLIISRINKVLSGDISNVVKDIFEKMSGSSSGLAREN